MVSCANATCSTSTDLIVISYPEEIGSHGLSSPVPPRPGRRDGASCLGAAGCAYIGVPTTRTSPLIPCMPSWICVLLAGVFLRAQSGFALFLPFFSRVLYPALRGAILDDALG